MEKIVETKFCKLCSASFDITDTDIEFYQKVSPVFGGEKYSIPTPTLCPDCRHQRRISFRNERKLYKRKCDYSGKEIISIYSPDKPFKVYDIPYWQSDVWDGKDFGCDVDFSKDFFRQLHSLSQQTPHISRYVLESIGADYINGAAHVKNSYLCFNVDYIEDSAYCFTTNNAKVSFDCSFCTNIENCYSCHTVDNSQTLFFSEESQECSNSYFLSNCRNCQHCFGSVNLVNKKYHIFNEPFSPEEYHKKIQELLEKNTFDQLAEKFQAHIQNFPKRQNLSYLNTNSLSEYSRQTKDSSYVFDCINIEDSKYLWYVYNAKSCMDYDIYGDSSELIYEAVMTGTNAYKNAFCFANWMGGRDCYYCILVMGCRNCFGCVGLKNQEYCIFNKQYTKEEYEILVPRIIEHMKKTGEWGEFFPGFMSPCGYNESVAQDYFQLTKEQAHTKGFIWSDYEAPFPKVEKIIPAKMLPNDITKIPDDVLNWAIECEKTKKPFRITQMELSFYRTHHFPLPKLHPEERHLERLHSRNPRKFFERFCNKCSKNIQTTYGPETLEKVYCEDCYNKEVY